jgi:membrane-bound acyltransferase YfiQ involved in biofilm formation
MQSLQPRRVRNEYLFVDSVRFWSMIAIVGMHGQQVFEPLGMLSPHPVQVLSTPLKFGTIAFFLISGFLLGDRLRTCDPTTYLSRRVKRVFVPWMCWFLLFFAMHLYAFHKSNGIPVTISLAEAQIVWGRIFYCLVDTAYWFVPNLLLGLCVLLVFRKSIYSLWLGAGLLAIDLFYVVNIYEEWMPSRHTEAFLGFVFYLWLGSYVSGHLERLKSWLSGVSMYALVAMTALAALLAYGEAQILFHRRSLDPLNTLRLSNQVFSVLVVLLLVKIGGKTWPRFVDVRRETFGIYLCHTIVLGGAIHLASKMAGTLAGSWWLTTHFGLVLVSLVAGGGTYGVSLGITKVLAGWRWTGWLVGAVDEGARDGKRLPRAEAR